MYTLMPSTFNLKEQDIDGKFHNRHEGRSHGKVPQN